MGWLPHLLTLVVGIGIGTIYGGWVMEGWYKEKEQANDSE